MTPAPTTAILEIQTSLGWAHDNPELFLETVRDFVGDHPEADWTRTVDTSRKGFMYFRATRKEAKKPRDYTLETVRQLAEIYLLNGDRENRKRNLQAVLTDMKIGRVANAFKAEHRCRLVDLFAPEGVIQNDVRPLGPDDKMFDAS